MSASKFIKFYEYGSAGIIQLNRPEALNAINFEMVTNLLRLLSKVEYQKDLVIVKGSGKIFSTGGDLKEISVGNLNATNMFYTKAYKCLDLIANYKKPYVALIDGLTIGGAAVYTMHAKYRIATERTAFSMPETSIGYINDVGASYFLSRLDNNFGFYMGMTGTPVKGFDMKKVGLATHYVESHKLDDLERSLGNCKTHVNVEKVLCEYSSHPPWIPTDLDQLLPKINDCFSGRSVEEIFNNLQRNESDWATKTIENLNKKSPTALKVTHRSMTAGRNISLRECMEMEMQLIIHHLIDSDFKEGMRAVLIDKDFKPKWSRKSIYDVTENDVERFFMPISETCELSSEENIKNKL